MSKRIRILFDANPIAIAGKSGVGHYAAYLVQSLADTYPDRVELIGHYYDFLGRKHPQQLPTAPNIRYRPTKLFPGKIPNMLRRLGLPIPFELLIKSRGDVLLFPNFLTQPSLFHKPIVVTVHDLCFLDHPEFVNTLNLHDLRRYVPQSIRRANLVLAVSEFTKQSIRNAYGVQDDMLLVTPVPPLNRDQLPQAQAKQVVLNLGIERPYILFVGNLEPRKNLSSLVEAYAQSSVAHTHSLILAGGRGWKNEALMQRINELQAQGADIILPGYITDEQKTALFQQASLVTMPSYYEGFGMPVLEAFAYSIPVAVSDIPVLREVAGDAAFYFDSHDIQSIADTLDSAITDTAERASQLKLMPKILKKYSWHDTARSVIAKIEEFISNREE
ncbi:MAG TPA: glycosyltransferase family 1 protein [Candidatus Saccharimonadales bacterium]|nr:glycosyltransferase family 1 protein [Candidatus Saccharimonadales bacterium]